MTKTYLISINKRDQKFPYRIEPKEDMGNVTKAKGVQFIDCQRACMYNLGKYYYVMVRGKLTTQDGWATVDGGLYTSNVRS